MRVFPSHENWPQNMIDSANMVRGNYSSDERTEEQRNNVSGLSSLVICFNTFPFLF